MTTMLAPGERRVLFADETELPYNLDEWAERGRVQKTMRRVTVTEQVNPDGTVTVAERNAVMVRGWASPQFRIGEEHGNTFARWETESYVSVTDRGDGSWLMRELAKPNGRRRHFFVSAVVLADTYPIRSRRQERLFESAVERFEPLVSRDVYYPTLSHFLKPSDADGEHLPAPWATGPVRRAFAGAPDAATLTVNLFGKSRYRKDLVKAVAMADLSHLDMAWMFRGLVPIDWIVEYLRLPPLDAGQDSWYARSEDLRTVVRHLDERSLRNLLFADHVHRIYHHDLVRMFDPADAAHIGRPRSWMDLHDRVARRNRFRYQTSGSGKPKRKMRLTDKQSALVGSSEDGLVFELATHEDQLWTWGTRMSNCILDYGHQMRSGHSWLGAVSDAQGRMVGNFEIRPGRRGIPTLVQLLGPSNRPLPAELRDQAAAYLRGHGVDVPRRYWGSSDD